MPSIIDRVLKISDNRVLRRMQGTVDAVNLLEEDFRALSDAELRAETDTLKARHADGESLDLLLPEAFAAVREAAAALGSWRVLDSTLYVTLEPCTMCAGAIVLSRIPRVVFATTDPKAGAAGSVLDVLADRRLNHRPEVVGGVLADEAAELLRAFFRARR